MLVQLAGLCVYSSWLSREVAPGGLDVEANRSDFSCFCNGGLVILPFHEHQESWWRLGANAAPDRASILQSLQAGPVSR
jgi:hypothetical protein